MLPSNHQLWRHNLYQKASGKPRAIQMADSDLTRINVTPSARNECVAGRSGLTWRR